MRQRLPNRRRNETAALVWPLDQGRPIKVHVCAGFTDEGTVAEVFLRGGAHTVAGVDHLLDDLAVLMSRCLQHGDTLADLRQAVGRHPGGKPSSIAGAALDLLADAGKT